MHITWLCLHQVVNKFFVKKNCFVTPLAKNNKKYKVIFMKLLNVYDMKNKKLVNE